MGKTYDRLRLPKLLISKLQQIIQVHVTLLVKPISDQIHRAGYKGIYLESAVSAFQAEVLAMDLAMQFVRQSVQLQHESMMKQKKGVRFTDF